jgi:hypothetical protein
MLVGCSFVYDLAQAEIVVRDLLAAPATYTYGQALKFGVTDGTDLGCVTSAGAGSGLLAAVSNEGGVALTKTLAGTVAAGTVETLKCIVNPNAVYRIEYDVSSPITWSAVTDTTIVFVTGGAGWVNFGGGWAWSYNTGKLDWVVSSATADPTTLTTVTGTDTTSTTGVLIYGQGKAVVTLNSAATKIAAGSTNIGTAGTNGFDAIVLANLIQSNTYGWEKLNPALNSPANTQGAYDVQAPSTTPTNRMNQAVRYMASQTTVGKTMDKAKAYADVWLGRGSAFYQLIITT